MYIQRIFNPFNVMRFSFIPTLIFTTWAAVVTSLYYFYGFEWLKIPWVPLTLLGIALAFYVGFKNNSAYDRTWEARKIWGGIVNSSRSWGVIVTGFVTDEFADNPVNDDELKAIHKRLIFRHIAWLYRLKRQLRALKPWEHDRKVNKRYRAYIKDLFPVDDAETELKKYLNEAEAEALWSKKNLCTHLIHLQSEDLKLLKRKGLIDDFRHMEMQGLLTEFYTLQGKCERIKNFPLPRQYASLSIYFVYIFIILLPPGLLSAFAGAMLPDYMIWGVVPFTTLLGWVFWMMEGAGDYTENPFEALAFDIPMSSLSRTIEIDLLEMLGETDLPDPIGPKDGFVV